MALFPLETSHPQAALGRATRLDMESGPNTYQVWLSDGNFPVRKPSAQIYGLDDATRRRNKRRPLRGQGAQVNCRSSKKAVTLLPSIQVVQMPKRSNVAPAALASGARSRVQLWSSSVTVIWPRPSAPAGS